MASQRVDKTRDLQREMTNTVRKPQEMGLLRGTKATPYSYGYP